MQKKGLAIYLHNKAASVSVVILKLSGALLRSPGYVSLNKRDDGIIVLLVRSRDAQLPSVIEMSPEALEQMAIDIMANINSDA